MHCAKNGTAKVAKTGSGRSSPTFDEFNIHRMPRSALHDLGICARQAVSHSRRGQTPERKNVRVYYITVLDPHRSHSSLDPMSPPTYLRLSFLSFEFISIGLLYAAPELQRGESALTQLTNVADCMWRVARAVIGWCGLVRERNMTVRKEPFFCFAAFVGLPPAGPLQPIILISILPWVPKVRGG